MLLIHFALAVAALTSHSSGKSFTYASPLSASLVADSLISHYPNRSLALFAPAEYYWWQSGSVIDALLNYFRATGDGQYNVLVANTLLSQASGTNDFMMPDATGNDDQAWWALAAMSAAEYGVPPAQGGLPWIDYAKNVFNDQKARWNNGSCNGGLKWKIFPRDKSYEYRSTISNGLFFQLAARIARFGNDTEALAWAEETYEWTDRVGLIRSNFSVIDGTDDSKGCASETLIHKLWSYNTGVFLYGTAIMADNTGNDAKWGD